MSGELGFLNSLHEKVIRPLEAFRTGNAPDCDGHPKDFDLIGYMQRAGFKNAAGNPVEWEDIWTDLGKDPAMLSIDNLLSMTGDMRYLAPEIVREYILKGMQLDQSHLDLIAGSENVNSMTVTSPWIEYSDEAPVETAEAETIAEAAMTWGEKTVKIRKKAKSLKVTDELVLSCPLPLLGYFLQKFGIALAAGLYVDAVTTMVNGDQSDGSDACAVIGVEETTDGITFKDFLRPWIRARRIGMRWNDMVTSETGAFNILQISQFSDPQGAGTTKVTVKSRNRVIPSEMGHSISGDVADDQAMLYDQRMNMIMLIFRPLLVESERIIMRQINGTAASITAGFTTIDRAARIIIDGGLAFASNGFPTWMAPLV